MLAKNTRSQADEAAAYKAECDRVLLSRTKRGSGTTFVANSGMTQEDIFDKLKRMQKQARS